MINASIMALINGLMFTLVLHASGQIDILCQELKNISKNILVHKSSMSVLHVLIKRHKRIISFSYNIEKLFSSISLMQIVVDTLVICCLGFLIIISIHNETGTSMIMKIILSYIALTTEVFVICFAGEYLSLKGDSIISSTYDTLWYDMPSTQARIILFVIMRSQKRLTITAGKMIDMSFETFTNIMKASVSYISVLNAMY
ncbi:odorant receptor 85b-like [Pogonomyrmex barbatus]|uniref:Odorant receptor 85b-like n=1 Tax=Pogonomyrmex barbatus TaxID=144034 RepID=A0A6I9VYF9_9HYME|nr:odorant receptor 85b-like [Pogonomyrmex barbatus]